MGRPALRLSSQAFCFAVWRCIQHGALGELSTRGMALNSLVVSGSRVSLS